MQKTGNGHLRVIAATGAKNLHDAVANSFIYLLTADTVQIVRKDNKILLILLKEHVTTIIQRDGLRNVIEKAEEIAGKRRRRGFLNQAPSYNFEFIK